MVKNIIFRGNAMSQSYQQNTLSDYYSLLSRNIKNDLGHKARSTWLNQHFGGLETVKSGSRHIAALPNAYHIEISDSYNVDVLLGDRLTVTPHRLEIVSDSLKECVGLLYKLVLSTSREKDGIDLYVPKQGQDSSLLVSGKAYLCVQQGDPLHDHKSKDLFDFQPVAISQRLQRVELLDFDMNHAHMIDTSLASKHIKRSRSP